MQLVDKFTMVSIVVSDMKKAMEFYAEKLGLAVATDYRRFGARSTLLTGGSPLGLAVGGILLAFVPATSVIAFSALACILVGLGGLLSPAFRGMSLSPADVGSEASSRR